MTANVLTVSQVNSYVKQMLDGDKNIRNIFISGEISNFRGNYSSGHWYFSLKDQKSSISAVMFAGNASRVRFTPEDGMEVIVTGRISLYEVTGQYQLYVDSMQPNGKGAVALAYEQLRNKLEAKGLFDVKHKRPLPRLPRRIGVITSPSGAVIQDIKNVVERRCPLTEIYLYPSAVQGDGAAEQLTRGIQYFNKKKNVDVIIIGRGGGSMEDLFCFNNEMLIWAIYDSSIPIISAVGHETDFTLCDFAMAVLGNALHPVKDIDLLFRRMSSRVSYSLSTSYQDIDRLKDSVASLHPERFFEKEMLTVQLLSTRIDAAAENKLIYEQEQLNAVAGNINALSPIRLLQKGYTVTTKRGKCVSSVAKVKSGDKLDVRFADGTAQCSVIKIKKLGE